MRLSDNRGGKASLPVKWTAALKLTIVSLVSVSLKVEYSCEHQTWFQTILSGSSKVLKLKGPQRIKRTNESYWSFFSQNSEIELVKVSNFMFPTNSITRKGPINSCIDRD
jgi:hypothetical protein